MDVKYIEEIRALTRSMREAGAGELELRRPDFSVRIVLKSKAEVGHPPSETHLVKAKYFGRLRMVGEVQGITLPSSGSAVQKNQILAFIDLDGLRFAVRAPEAGTLTQSLASEGSLVEFDDDLFKVTAPSA